MRITNSGTNAKQKKAKSTVDRNNSRNNMLIILLIVVISMLIVWVYSMGKKAEETVAVAMYANSLAKNQVVTADDLVKYDMTKAEFEKYAVENSDGTKSRRIMLWEEAPRAVGMFAAYTIQKNTVVMYRDFISSRIDNSDSVLYSYPGKDIVTLDVGTQDLTAFKTFLQPGDRVNIEVLYSSTEEVVTTDEYGNETKEKVDIKRYETAFPSIILADLLNSDGASILDIYDKYNAATTYQQAQMDSSDEFKKSVTPSTMILALTPEEKVAYFDYLKMGDVEFRMTLPQRTE